MKAMSEFEGDIIALADLLRAVPIGGVVTYAQFDKSIGRSIRAQRYLLQAARTRVEKETGAIFQAVFNVGFKRLPIESYASIGQHSRKGIRRKARVASKRMQNGLDKANEVPADVLRAVSREQSVLGLIQFAARDTTLKKMLDDMPISAPTPLATAAKDLMRALGIEIDEGEPPS
jgi:hypothetical protein